MQWARKNKDGFTIVELLIVVIVIAILATITIVGFRGIQNRANDSAVQADLRNFVTAARAKKELGQIAAYPMGSDSFLNEIRFSFARESYDTTTGALLYCTNSDNQLMVIYGRSKSGNQYYYASDGRAGRTTTSLSSYSTLCSDFTGMTSSDYARYGRSANTWNSWTRSQ